MIKNLGYYIYYNIRLVLSYMVESVSELFPDVTPQKSIDIEDDWDEVEDTYDETDDSMMTRGDKSINRNRWGLPVIDEEE
tara:strand:- start:1240 stop:1479 length:240 start_codon:yes stop_codon:yes gene_type:complete